MYILANVADLVGRTFSEVRQGDYDGSDAIYFDDEFVLGHRQDCCESFGLTEIHGELSDLAGAPILQADESREDDEEASESGTWTFYRLATMKGHVQLRFHGESNGYYSESANLYQLTA